MYVQVVDYLSGIDALVHGESISAFSDAKSNGDPGTNAKQMTKQRFMLFGSTRDVGDVFARHYQHMDIGERVDVVEGKALIVRINLGRRLVTVDDVAKQAIGLPELIFFFFCSPPHNVIPYKPIALASIAL
tara:strand:- start:114 stop:506 length:393 start_codon:yes stop_codon:yes gene_type:complete